MARAVSSSSTLMLTLACLLAPCMSNSAFRRKGGGKGFGQGALRAAVRRESLVAEIEKEVGAPAATPAEIANAMARMPDASGSLTALLFRELEEVARHHGGRVPLSDSDSLFVEWLDRAFPGDSSSAPFSHALARTVPLQHGDEELLAYKDGDGVAAVGGMPWGLGLASCLLVLAAFALLAQDSARSRATWRSPRKVVV